MPTGCTRASTSTTTSRSTATITRSRTRLIHAAVDVRLTATTVDDLPARHARLAPRAQRSCRAATPRSPEHMPKAHRAHLEWSPSRLIGWGATIGPAHRGARPADPRESARIPSRAIAPAWASCGWRSSTARRGSTPPVPARVAVGARSYRHVESILKHGLDRLPLAARRRPPPRARVTHANVRGPGLLPLTEGDPP